MWKLIQFSVIVAIVGSNGAYHWTPNGYVAGLIAVGAAFFVTLGLSSLLDLWRSLRANQKLRGQ